MKYILCVDDEKDVLKDITAVLRQRGYEVESASTSAGAVDLISAHPFRFDAVLTDLDFGRSDPHNGLWLVQQILGVRESRGYDPAPEVIGLTGKMIDADVLNRLEALGGHYVLKGRAESYLVEIDAAMARLDRFRQQGPTLEFVHTCSTEPLRRDEDITSRFGCAVGESINSVNLLHSGIRLRIPIAPAPLLLFDYLARRAVRRPLRLEEIANGMNSEEFYYFWLGREKDHTVSSDSVKMNIRRIRKALDAGFKAASLPITHNSVLTSERTAGDLGDDDSENSAYRLKACVLVDHVR